MKNSIEINKVYQTKEYGIFKHIKGNRDIDERNLRSLIHSMKERPLDIPIIINENGEIIDGQHRLESFQALNLPVPYIKVDGYSIDDVQRANMTGKRWNINDKMNLFISKGTESYKSIESINKEYDIPILSIINIYAKASGISFKEMKYLFEKGKFNNGAQKSVDLFIMQLMNFKKYTCVKRNSFISAFLELHFIKEPFKYDHSIIED
jgi:hypothetical protein